MSDATRLEITSYDKIVFEGQFPSFNAAADFHAWWSNQKELPQGGATIAAADTPFVWREKHPLERVELTAGQRKLIEDFCATCRGVK